ncbi:MAG: homocysteine S-methyltransferase family protein, partial [Muribaculaceae bacterium]|nr:homocysteine S-methyltransferase family protein [Muribaculaceae bacterium]
MTFEQNLRERVLVLDGAMGTMIQRFNLTENDFRGSQFAQSPVALKGCNDLLSLTRPDIIAGIHRAYIEAGADIIETNSFNANAISLAEYGLTDRVTDINRAAARIAVEEARREQRLTGRKVYVAGSMGPGNVALSMPDSADDPHHVTFDSMAKAYEEQAVALISEGVDILLLETIFDTLNAKAAISGIKRAFQQTGCRPHLMVSVTLTQTGRTLSGQTLDAFVASIRHAGAISIGLNCGFGARDMEPYLYTLRK